MKVSIPHSLLVMNVLLICQFLLWQGFLVSL